jgi:shikimate kinase
MRVFLVGPPGAGKSTVGRHLAAQLQASFFDLDEVIQERAGADIPWIFDVEGESGFRDREVRCRQRLCYLEIMWSLRLEAVLSSEPRIAPLCRARAPLFIWKRLCPPW